MASQGTSRAPLNIRSWHEAAQSPAAGMPRLRRVSLGCVLAGVSGGEVMIRPWVAEHTVDLLTLAVMGLWAWYSIDLQWQTVSAKNRTIAALESTITAQAETMCVLTNRLRAAGVDEPLPSGCRSLGPTTFMPGERGIRYH